MKSMKDAMHDLVTGAAPSVKLYLKIWSYWKDIMTLNYKGKTLELYLLTEPLMIRENTIYIGAYSPAVASVIKRYENMIKKKLKNLGLSIKHISVKVVETSPTANEGEVTSEFRHRKKDFSEEEMKKAEEKFLMVEDKNLRRKLAIVWLKSKTRGGSDSV